MATPAPQQHLTAPVAVDVCEEYGYNRYINMVADPNNIQHSELGSHLDVGPVPVSHTVHYHMDEIESRPYPRSYDGWTDEQVSNVVHCRRDYMHTALDYACDELGQEIRGREMTIDLIRQAWQNRVREAMCGGTMLATPSWLKAAEIEARYNKATRGGSYRTRKALVRDLILEGRVNPGVFGALKPTHSEIASMITEVTSIVDDGISLYDAWEAVLIRLTKEERVYVFGVITGEAVADNALALQHMCSRLFMGTDALTPVLTHFKYAESIYLSEEYPDEEAFEECLLDHEIIARANYSGSEEADETAHELWLELVDEMYSQEGVNES